jgi:Arc/MetJ family transcription regulator
VVNFPPSRTTGRAHGTVVPRPGGSIFKGVLEARPYPEHGARGRDWAAIPPRPVQLDELITTKRELQIDRLFAEDSTFFGDLFCHVVAWRGEKYLEDGLHRALHAALQQRRIIYARVLPLPDDVE